MFIKLHLLVEDDGHFFDAGRDFSLVVFQSIDDLFDKVLLFDLPVRFRLVDDDHDPVEIVLRIRPIMLFPDAGKNFLCADKKG